jgi:hypothetical protein
VAVRLGQLWEEHVTVKDGVVIHGMSAATLELILASFADLSDADVDGTPASLSEQILPQTYPEFVRSGAILQRPFHHTPLRRIAAWVAYMRECGASVSPRLRAAYVAGDRDTRMHTCTDRVFQLLSKEFTTVDHPMKFPVLQVRCCRAVVQFVPRMRRANHVLLLSLTLLSLLLCTACDRWKGAVEHGGARGHRLLQPAEGHVCDPPWRRGELGGGPEVLGGPPHHQCRAAGGADRRVAALLECKRQHVVQYVRVRGR